jgi:hypothetical protein
LAAENGPCICGSKALASACCLQENGQWHKTPVKVGLRQRPVTMTVHKCYMGELRSCEAPISREHLITESVMEVLQGDGEFSLSGVPWMPLGETQVISKASLVAKCLCKGHNSAVTGLDNAARDFSKVLKSCLEQKNESDLYLFSGHDIERWLLKSRGSADQRVAITLTRFARSAQSAPTSVPDPNEPEQRAG